MPTKIYKRNFFIFIIFVSLVASSIVSGAEQTKLNFKDVMQRVLERYPSLKISELEVSQAFEQRRQVESSLGWVLNSSVGITHDLTGLGTPSDRLDINSSIDRKLKSGATLSLSGGYRYEDSSLSFSPVLPNPAHTTRLDLSYRFPFLQGNDNPIFIEGVVAANSEHELAKANQLLVLNTLADRVKDIFYSSLLIKSRIKNTQQSMQRTKNLSRYITKNLKLGLSENKDKLQINAELHSRQAELSALELQWNGLNNSLIRLMVKDRRSVIEPILIKHKDTQSFPTSELIKITENFHPLLKLVRAQLRLAQSQINLAKDKTQDSLDVVMSVGTRTSNGNNATSTISEQDWAGAASIQYKHFFDDNGIGSKYRQALLEKDIALQNILKTTDDIHYTVSGLMTDIESARSAVKTAFKRLQSESLKLKETENRFRNGRADTAQLIRFQNEYSFAELNYQNQKIDLNKRIISLEIYSGQFWWKLPIHDGFEK